MKKKVLSFVLALAMALSLLPGTALAAEAGSPDDIVILYTNDVHSYITEDITYSDVAALKDSYENVLLVDTGDHIQGTAYGGMDEGETIIELMNTAGYDLATLGNHEFDYGMDGCMQAMAWAAFPYVSCNFRHEADGVPGETVLDACKIFDVNGTKVAIVGITTPETITSSAPSYFQDGNGNFIYGIDGGADGSALYDAVQTAVDAAIGEGADYVIALGHLGIDPSSAPYRSTDVIAHTTGIDAFIDGHSHSTVAMQEVENEAGGTVILTQTGSYLNAVGKLTIGSGGAITTELLTADSDELAALTPDAAVKTIEDAWADEVNALLGQVIGYAEVVFDNFDNEGNRLVRKQSTNTGDFCADALYYLFDEMDMDVDVAVMNGGGIRNGSLTGELSYLTCKEIHTFGNVACLLTVTGQQLLDALEWGSKDLRADGTAESGSFLHVSGLQYTLDLTYDSTVQSDDRDIWTGPPTGEYRVRDVYVLNSETDEYEPLDPDASYNLAGYNYTLRDLGGGFAMLSDAVNVLDYVMEDYMVLANYIQSFPVDDTTGLPTITGEDCYYDITGSGRINIITHECADEDSDHYCDREDCDQWLTDCEDWDHDRFCDICGEGVYPSPEELYVDTDAYDGQITMYWSALDPVGDDEVIRYVAYCNDDDGTVDLIYEDTEGMFSCTFTGLTNGVAYNVGVDAEYASGHGIGLGIMATPVQKASTLIAVGDTIVLQDGEVVTAAGEGWSFDAETATLTLNDADITTDYVYDDTCAAGIYADGELNIQLEGTSHVTATDSARRSSGIRVKGALAVSGSGTLYTTGGNVTVSGPSASPNSYGLFTGGDLQLFSDATIFAAGGTVTAPQCTKAYSNGVLSYGSVSIDNDSSLIATGGAVSAKSAYSVGLEVWGSPDEYLNIAVYEGHLETAGGPAAGEILAESTGIYAYMGGLYAYENSAMVIAASDDAAVSADSEDAYACSNGIYVYGGDIGIDAGTVTVSGGSWSGANGDGIAVYAQAATEEDENGEVIVQSGGSVRIDGEHVAVSPIGPGLVGTRVTVTAAEGDPAILAEGDLRIDGALTFSVPEGGQIATRSEHGTDFLITADRDGNAASHVVIEPLGCTVSITGLQYGMAAQVPAGQSLNEAYCERYGVEDFSEILRTDKAGYVFAGWYTDTACTDGNEFSFDDAITADITIYPKWIAVQQGSDPGDMPAPPAGGGTVQPDADETHEDCLTDRFMDLEQDAWYHDYVEYMLETGLMQGAAEQRFLPGSGLSRQALWMILSRLSGENFTSMYDVRDWAVANGVSDGTNPVSVITRQQFVTMLWRWAKAQGMDVSVGEDTNILSYEDAFDISEYAIPAFQWACGAGIMNGYADGTLRPLATATRAHAAKLLTLFLQDVKG